MSGHQADGGPRKQPPCDGAGHHSKQHVAAAQQAAQCQMDEVLKYLTDEPAEPLADRPSKGTCLRDTLPAGRPPWFDLAADDDSMVGSPWRGASWSLAECEPPQLDLPSQASWQGLRHADEEEQPMAADVGEGATPLTDRRGRQRRRKAEHVQMACTEVARSKAPEKEVLLSLAKHMIGCGGLAMLRCYLEKQEDAAFAGTMQRIGIARKGTKAQQVRQCVDTLVALTKHMPLPKEAACVGRVAE